MSKRKIESALKRKGITPTRVEYMRSCPTPSGCGCGWDIELLDETEDMIYEADSTVNASTYMEFDDLNHVLSWIETLPNISQEEC